jgi:hypothetical protein
MGLAWVLDHFAEIGQYAAQQVVEGIDLGRGQTGRGFAVGVSEEIQRHRHDLLGVALRLSRVARRSCGSGDLSIKPDLTMRCSKAAAVGCSTWVR